LKSIKVINETNLQESRGFLNTAYDVYRPKRYEISN